MTLTRAEPYVGCDLEIRARDDQLQPVRSRHVDDRRPVEDSLERLAPVGSAWAELLSLRIGEVKRVKAHRARAAGELLARVAER